MVINHILTGVILQVRVAKCGSYKETFAALPGYIGGVTAAFRTEVSGPTLYEKPFEQLPSFGLHPQNLT